MGAVLGEAQTIYFIKEVILFLNFNTSQLILWPCFSSFLYLRFVENTYTKSCPASSVLILSFSELPTKIS